MKKRNAPTRQTPTAPCHFFLFEPHAQPSQLEVTRHSLVHRGAALWCYGPFRQSRVEKLFIGMLASERLAHVRTFGNHDVHGTTHIDLRVTSTCCRGTPASDAGEGPKGRRRRRLWIASESSCRWNLPSDFSGCSHQTYAAENGP
jgi:hypothetical protein